MVVIDAAIVLGLAVILPLALGGRYLWWAVAAVSAAVALTLSPGRLAAVLLAPLAVVVVATARKELRRAGLPSHWTLDDLAHVVAAGFGVVAATALTASRLGVALFGVGEPIVELTAVHFTYGGAAALSLAGAALRPSTGRALLVAGAAVLVTVVAPPIVALGFVTSAALPQVGGAVMMTLGVWLTAVLHLRAAADGREKPAARLLLGISGLAVWAPMVLAVAWAASQYWDVPALSIHDMARTHGVANALGFVLCGLVGRRLATPRMSDAARSG